MSRAPRSTGPTASLLVLVGGIALFASPPEQDRLFVAAETGEPVAFAQVLISARQPVVLVLPYRLSDATRETIRSPVIIGSASRLVDAFNHKQGKFKAELAAGVFQITEAALPAVIRRVLEQEHDVSFDDMAVGESMFKVASLISPSGHQPGAAPARQAGAAPRGCPLGTSVHASLTAMSLRGVLSEIVRQEPGVAWALTYDSNPSPTQLTLELLCAEGYTRTMTIRDWNPRASSK